MKEKKPRLGAEREATANSVCVCTCNFVVCGKTNCSSDPPGIGATERNNYIPDGAEWVQGCSLGMETFLSLSELYILSSVGGLSLNVGGGCSFLN